MRYLILSDIHSNWEALQAVTEIAAGAYDRVICCGDLVGYGPDPDAVVEWVRQNVAAVVRGNHDKACAGLTDAADFTEAARTAAYWTRCHINPDNKTYLENLDTGPKQVDELFAIVHGSLRDEDEYITAGWTAADIFELLSDRVNFFGHTHLQGGFIKSRRRIIDVPLKPFSTTPVSGLKQCGVLEIQADETYYLNPGSVGQPRDHDARAAFVIYDTDGLVEYGRVRYDVETTMKKILNAGLPEQLAYRLSVGR
ncbi:MAG: metallophosphoesterase family protein [Acidobacteria bacterium]|nr:metallophosphoesterase family protein [Acidobacteriota bacterium]